MNIGSWFAKYMHRTTVTTVPEGLSSWCFNLGKLSTSNLGPYNHWILLLQWSSLTWGLVDETNETVDQSVVQAAQMRLERTSPKLSEHRPTYLESHVRTFQEWSSYKSSFKSHDKLLSTVYVLSSRHA